MPSSLHPQAKFDPIPPDFDLNALVEKTPTFDYVMRMSRNQIDELGLAEFEKLVMLHVIVGGKPLVIEGWDNSLPPWLFSRTWLEDNMGKKQEIVRDISNSTDIPMSMRHYLRAMGKLTKQWTTTNYRDPERQRLYLKDIDCPEPWYQHLQTMIPETLFYLNESIGEKGGPCALHERNVYNQLVLGKGVGPAGDLMSNLPPEMRAENMMCYIGHEGTYTPAHREMCASLGQNIMVEASGTEDDEKPGSSLWFMTESKDHEVVSEYFLSMLGHDIEVESHFAQVNAWKKAPFPVYIVEQKVGDFILIPPLAPHQVWNRGTRTMKVAWNRTTVETLELAMHEALPRARMVCRDEQYKNKAIMYFSLLRYYNLLKRAELAEESSWEGGQKDSIRNNIRVRQLKRDFKRLFALFTNSLIGEMFSSDLPREKHIELLPFDGNVTCSYCRCNIFNRFLTCKTCISKDEVTGEEETYDVCMECYAMGRSCACISNLKWVEQWQWLELSGRHDDWRAMVIANDGFVDDHSPPQTLDIARSLYGKKPVAQICQEELKKRPWKDITKPCEAELSLGDSEAEEEDIDKARLKRKKAAKRKSKQLRNSNRACHICQHRDRSWKLAFCSTCPNAYCYGTLWRAFDLKPQTVMENPNWQCPKCLQICSCGKCRRDISQNAYRPKGTRLGHDTKRVADPRSVESLVDFSRTNLTWLRDEGDNNPHTSLRMQKLMEKAKSDKARNVTVEEDPVNNIEQEEEQENGLLENVSIDDMAIDPQLNDHTFSLAEHTDELDGTHFDDDSTLTLAHLPDSDQQTASIPGTDHLLHASETDVQTGNGYYNGYHPHYVAPEATMFVPESINPDPSGRRPDRMMGMAYYQQSNDADKILFDDPEASSVNGFDRGFTYPRLVDMPDSFSDSKSDENNISNQNTTGAYGTHTNAVQSKKKPKNSRPEANVPHDMTQDEDNKILSSMRSCPKRKPKESLHNAKWTLESQIQPEGNIKMPETSNGMNEHQPQSQDSGGTAVGYDVSERTVQGIHRQQDARHEYNIILATQAIQNLIAPTDIPTPGTQSKQPEVLKKRGRGRPRKIPAQVTEIATETERASEKEVQSDTSQKVMPLGPKRGRGRPSSTVSKTNTKEHSPPRPSSFDNLTDGRRSAEQCFREQAGESHGESSRSGAEVGENTEIQVQDKTEHCPLPNSGTSLTEDRYSSSSSGGNYPASNTPASTLQTDTNLSAPAEDYQITKEDILRTVEAELQEEENSRQQHSEKIKPAAAAHTKAPTGTTVSLRTKVSKYTVKTVPKSPSGKPLSLADQPALKSKPFNIAPEAMRRQPALPVVSTSVSNVRSARFSVIVHQNPQHDSNGPLTDTLSSDSDDDFIPAIRPVAKKPRVEVFATRNGLRSTRT